jgi:hypothetical protein
MHTLWGEEERSTPQPTPTQKRPSHANVTTVALRATDCLVYGHTWQTAGMLGEQQCSVCHSKGYCPGCSPKPSVNALPLYCSKHTGSERSA